MPRLISRRLTAGLLPAGCLPNEGVTAATQISVSPDYFVDDSHHWRLDNCDVYRTLPICPEIICMHDVDCLNA
jgi:hypothetical protein